ncbi:MAG: S4 domain-containing protein [Ruthenibacterium sp.]
MRLDKFTAKALGLSRSQARETIRAGRILLNGEVCRAPDAHVPEGAAVACDGRPLCAKEFVYLMLDKPKGVVSAAGCARHHSGGPCARGLPPAKPVPRGQAG